jgi:hypothetical protein
MPFWTSLFFNDLLIFYIIILLFNVQPDTSLVIMDNLKNFDSSKLGHIYYLSSLNYYSWLM